MDEARDYYTQWNKSEKQTSYTGRTNKKVALTYTLLPIMTCYYTAETSTLKNN